MAKREPFSLTIKDCKIEYPKFSINVPEFTVLAGTVTALLGPSGSGKSTLLNCMGMLENVGKYRVFMDDKEVQPDDVHGRVTAVFQRPYLMKGTVEDNVGYGLKLHKVARPERKQRVKEVLDLVGLSGKGPDSASRLSGGEAQRVALARALALEPAGLLLDEPLSSLDASLKRAIAREFARILKESNTTALYITHDVDEALILADNIAIIMDGRIVAHGPIRETITLVEDERVAEFLEVDRAFPATVTSINDDIATVSSPMGELFIPADKKNVGDNIFCSVKPEKVDIRLEDKLDEPVDAFENKVEGRLLHTTPMHLAERLTFKVGDYTLSGMRSVSATNLNVLEPGDSATLVFPPDAVRSRQA